MKYTFSHSHQKERYLALFLLGLLILIALFQSQDSTTFLLTLAIFGPFPLFILGQLIWHSWRLTLTDTAITWQRLGQKKQLRYKEITGFKQVRGGNLLLIGNQEQIFIDYHTDALNLLYDLLRQKVAAFREAEQDTFPWELRLNAFPLWLRMGLMVFGALAVTGFIVQLNREPCTNLFFILPILVFVVYQLWRELMQPIGLVFTPETITAFWLSGDKKNYDVSQLQQLKLYKRAQRRKTGVFVLEHQVLLQFANKQKLIISQRRAVSFGYLPEMIVHSLYHLYPHMNPYRFSRDF